MDAPAGALGATLHTRLWGGYREAAQVDLSGPRYTNVRGGRDGDVAVGSGVEEFCRSLADRIRRVPGVENVAIAGPLPTSDGTELPVSPGTH